MIRLSYHYAEEKYDGKLSRLERIPERDRRTDRQMDRRTELLYQYRA